MKKISVIIPIYNVEKFLPQCLDSILAQTLNDLEVICVNDGSPDNCSQILSDYAKKDSRIVVMEQKNKGVCAARNAAIKIANAEYIGFVDPDDWIESDFYQNLYEKAKVYDADIVGTGFCSVRNNYKKTMYSVREIKTALTVEEKFKIFKMPENNYIWNKIYKKSVIIDNEIFFLEGICYEDIIWSSQVMEFSKLALMIPTIGYNYRYNNNSIVNTTFFDSKKMKDQEFAHKFQRGFMEKHKMKIKPNYDKKIKIKFFGFTILKIMEAYDYKKIIYLFGLKLFEIKTQKKR
ncbi:MAG: glycosyltransferase [Alphaproteobacteria bacterium]|nr:glycosyltransferase [Alphaproteobacteria bacterium]